MLLREAEGGGLKRPRQGRADNQLDFERLQRVREALALQHALRSQLCVMRPKPDRPEARHLQSHGHTPCPMLASLQARLMQILANAGKFGFVRTSLNMYIHICTIVA
eukprot:6179786-Pleurochrysis_carterae.AAC.5